MDLKRLSGLKRFFKSKQLLMERIWCPFVTGTFSSVVSFTRTIVIEAQRLTQRNDVFGEASSKNKPTK